jgi:hypothetical protein
MINFAYLGYVYKVWHVSLYEQRQISDWAALFCEKSVTNACSVPCIFNVDMYSYVVSLYVYI